MSIFRREADSSRPAPSTPATSSSSSTSAPAPAPAPSERDRRSQPAAPATPTHIAAGTKINGQVSGQSDLVVDGELEGQVDVESSVTIGADGRVKGNVTAKSVRIGGRVTGNVQGKEKVEILPSGRLEGDVAAPRVVLAEGAFFKGKVEMTGGQGKAAKESA
jgi:cytoskeletal protein CcmA (bactofilin family)